jgi:hypothetical protein
VVAAVHPVCRMIGHACAHHVQVDLHKATVQMLIRFDSRGMITIFPKTPHAAPCARCILAHCGPRSVACYRRSRLHRCL